MFEEHETPFDVAAVLLALCAYPEPSKIEADGPAQRFWEAVYQVSSRGNRVLHPVAGLPARRPSRRDAMACVNKGFGRIQTFHEVNAALQLYWTSNGALSFQPSRDLRKLNIRFQLDAAGKITTGAPPERPSLTQFLKLHQPAIGLGRDELGSDERENAKTLRKRIIAPMLRVAHVLVPLRSEILSLEDTTLRWWPASLLQSAPVWAHKVVERSRMLAPIEAALARRAGIRKASMDRMIHFHLPRHVRILPPAREQFRD